MDTANWQRFGVGCVALSMAVGGAMVKAEIVNYWPPLILVGAIGFIFLTTVRTK